MKENDIIGYLIAKERSIKNNRAYWNCLCTLCNQMKNIREDTLNRGGTISCGCYKKSERFREKQQQNHEIENLTGNVYGELTVLKKSDKRVGKKILWTCQCSCGEIVDVWSANLKNGNSKTCGGAIHRIEKLKDVWAQTLSDLIGQQFGDWLVLGRDGQTQPTRWICECQNCKTIKSVIGSSLKSGESQSCGCRRSNASLEGQTIGRWRIGKRSKRKRPNGHFCTTYLCTCECGTTRYVDEARLLNGTSLSCGCVNSKANEYISGKLREHEIKFIPEYSFEELRGPNNGLLRFDFAVFSEESNIKCLIEYQGEQHYMNGDFGRAQREITDPLKRKFCKENGFTLFEIKYTDNIDAKLDKIITQITC